MYSSGWPKKHGPILIKKIFWFLLYKILFIIKEKNYCLLQSFYFYEKNNILIKNYLFSNKNPQNKPNFSKSKKTIYNQSPKSTKIFISFIQLKLTVISPFVSQFGSKFWTICSTCFRWISCRVGRIKRVETSRSRILDILRI